MNILISSHVFSPSIGGIEQCTLDLAQEFLRLGHEVRIVTQSLSKNPREDDNNLSVIRKPSVSALLKLIEWCNVYFHNNVSIRSAWPLLFVRRPWVVTSQTWLSSRQDKGGAMKRLALSKASNIFISDAIRKHVDLPGVCIPNPYNAKVFKILPDVTKSKDLVFVGRLVSDKGCDLLISALRKLKEKGLNLNLTIVGDGPERPRLLSQINDLGLGEQVCLKGVLKGNPLAAELNHHRIMVVPSRWNEPFGIVALEGIACGCVVVASKGGGLSDAVGPSGITFPNGDVDGLTAAIEQLYQDESKLIGCANSADEHLLKHRTENIAQQYIEVFERARSL